MKKLGLGSWETDVRGPTSDFQPSAIFRFPFTFSLSTCQLFDLSTTGAREEVRNRIFRCNFCAKSKEVGRQRKIGRGIPFFRGKRKNPFELRTKFAIKDWGKLSIMGFKNFAVPFCAFLLLFFSVNSFAQAQNRADKLIEKAVSQYQRGNTPIALDLIYKILEKYPKNKRAMELYQQIKEDEAMRLFKAAAIYFENGEKEMARKKLDKGRALSVDVFLKFIKKKVLDAKALLANQDVVECANTVSEILFFSPGNADAQKIQALLKSDFFKSVYKSILKERRRLAWEKVAEAKNVRDNPIRALSIVNEALSLDPSNKEAEKLRKSLLKEIKTEEKSLLTKTEEQRKKDEEKAMKLYLKAEKYYRKKKYEKCYKLATRSIKYNPQLVKARELLKEISDILYDSEVKIALYYFSRGKFSKARKHIEKARFYNPRKLVQLAKDVVDKANKLIAAGQKQKGLALLRQAEIINPLYKGSEAVASGQLKIALDGVWKIYRAEKYKNALKQIKEIEKGFPNNLDVIFLKDLIQAQIALDDGNFLTTRKFLLAAIKIKPMHQEVWGFFNRLDEILNLLGYKLENLQNKQEAK